MPWLTVEEFYKVRDEELKGFTMTKLNESELDLIREHNNLKHGYFADTENGDEWELLIYEKDDLIIKYLLFLKNTQSEGPLHYDGFYKKI